VILEAGSNLSGQGIWPAGHTFTDFPGKTSAKITVKTDSLLLEPLKAAQSSCRLPKEKKK